MASLFRRADSPYLWMKWRDAAGLLRKAATKFRKDDPDHVREAKRALAIIERQEENIRRTGSARPLTVRHYAEEWVAQRK